MHHYEQNAVNSTDFDLVTESFLDIDVGGISTPEFTDIDGDGLIDLIIGETDGNLNQYEQDEEGSYNFTLITESFNDIHIGKISTPCFGDIDDDGLLELFVGENVGPIHYFKQNSPGSAHFDSITAAF